MISLLLNTVALHFGKGNQIHVIQGRLDLARMTLPPWRKKQKTVDENGVGGDWRGAVVEDQ